MMDDPKLFDGEHLATYTRGDASLEAEVLQMFLDQSEKYLERLKSPKNTRDWQETAHSLKGTARGVGAFKVGMRAEQLEKTAEPLQASSRTAILSLLQKDMVETRSAIQSHLAK